MKTIKLAFVLSFALLPILGWAKSKTLTIGEIVLEPEDSLSFSLEEMPDEIDGLPVMSEFLPDGVDVEWTGKKFKTPKAGRVKYSKKEEDFVSTSEDNPSGLKVSINKKSGRVKGSFKVYVQKSEKKVKSYRASVSGTLGSDLVITIRRAGSFAGHLE